MARKLSPAQLAYLREQNNPGGVVPLEKDPAFSTTEERTEQDDAERYNYHCRVCGARNCEHG